MQPGGSAITLQPTVHPRAQMGGHLVKQLIELHRPETSQIFHIHMPQILCFANQSRQRSGPLPGGQTNTERRGVIHDSRVPTNPWVELQCTKGLQEVEENCRISGFNQLAIGTTGNGKAIACS